MSNFERFGAKEVQNQDVEVSRETEVHLAD